MGQANPCRICESTHWLKFKTFNYEEWWIMCDKCGLVGKSGPDRQTAGEAWNKDNKIRKQKEDLSARRY